MVFSTCYSQEQPETGDSVDKTSDESTDDAEEDDKNEEGRGTDERSSQMTTVSDTCGRL